MSKEWVRPHTKSMKIPEMGALATFCVCGYLPHDTTTVENERVSFREPGEPQVLLPVAEYALLKELVLLLASRHLLESLNGTNGWDHRDNATLVGLVKTLSRKGEPQ